MEAEAEMESEGSRVAVIGIIVENGDMVENVNSLLHQYSQYVIGRMGLPYRRRGISIISVVVDAPSDVISGLSGKLGRLSGVTSQVLYTKK